MQTGWDCIEVPIEASCRYDCIGGMIVYLDLANRGSRPIDPVRFGLIGGLPSLFNLLDDAFVARRCPYGFGIGGAVVAGFRGRGWRVRGGS